MSFHLKIINITCNVYSNIVKKINLSGIEGELGIYTGHTYLLTTIKPGLLYILNDNNTEKHFYITGGIIEIQPIKVTILADKFFYSSDMNELDMLAKKETIKKNILHYANNHNKLKLLNQKFLTISKKLHFLDIVKKSRLK
ncbi:F0F1-type ATP synthase, epsilon subunit [Buchnera aphidicola (Nipponaphis monzeni)]|uniref:ATP synthase epsilon chain n=1 Tax=Buchnera aphidicola (Nipponaphis monzeni) TaxID=2495405 RepID=A0A455T9K7_9GAMM|nr:ATP synthase F1 subunit epsilon [Buchnera aphidicola]BBI01027.1 F0F1-type ATP synthase, epsilon subunit [Buchnera aphidicola (Nipponaphis monzeni)]